MYLHDRGRIESRRWTGIGWDAVFEVLEFNAGFSQLSVCGSLPDRWRRLNVRTMLKGYQLSFDISILHDSYSPVY